MNELWNRLLIGAEQIGTVLPALAVLRLRRTGHRAAAAWTTAALLLYVFVLVLTMGVSVPLNDQLAAAGDGATIADPAAVRDAFAGRWVPVNVVRALASTAALASLGRALFLHGGRR